VNVAVPTTLGTPEIVPVEELIVSPVGRLPELIDHLYGAMPPLTCSVWLYALPTGTEGSVVAAIFNMAAATAMVIETEVAWAGLLLSFTTAVKVAVPLTLGMPEIVPVEELSARPVGRLPEAIDHL
jgi:hypothetical protein